MANLAEAFPIEQARCRALLKEYLRIGPAGAFGVNVIEQTLAEAERAVAAQDTIAMIAAFKRMQEHE